MRRFFQKISENRNFQRGNITAIPEKKNWRAGERRTPPWFSIMLFSKMTFVLNGFLILFPNFMKILRAKSAILRNFVEKIENHENFRDFQKGR